MSKIDSFRGRYAFLSNFYHAPFTFQGMNFSNSEAAFQSQKSTDPNVQKMFCSLDASQAKRLGRRVILRDGWDNMRLDVMYDVCLAKFSQHPNLKQMLLDTGDAYLEEGNTWNDKFWGTCNGVGENNLGKTLMRIREEFKNS